MRLLSLLLLSIVTLGSHAAMAESKDYGPYEVHYSVFNSSFISPEVAKAYDIVRAKDQVLVNVSIRKKIDNGDQAHAAVAISGSSSDLIHKLPLKFREIREQGAIYYLAPVKIANKERRVFYIDVQAEPNRPAYKLNFNKVLYHD